MTKIWICMLCIHIISILCRVPKRDAEISGHVDLRIGFAQLPCQLSTGYCGHNIHIHTMLGYCRSLKHIKTARMNHGAWVFKLAAEEQAIRYRLCCLLNMPEGSRESFLSYAETDRSNFKLILHSYNYITNIRTRSHSDFSEWGGPLQTFWKRIRFV